MAKNKQSINQENKIQEPVAEYARNKEVPTFFGKPLFKGSFTDIDSPEKTPHPQRFYSHPNGEIWVGDSITWLRSLGSETADLIFADPPYNIKKAEWDTFESQEQYVKWSLEWIEEAARILKPTGTMYISGFSEI